MKLVYGLVTLFLWACCSIIKCELLTMKEQKHCSVKNPSIERINSLFIVDYIEDIKNGVPNMKDCFTSCHDNQNCDYFAFNEPAKQCLFLKGDIGHEAISRFLYIGWDYGRIVSTNQKLYLYSEVDTCNEPFCQNSCLKDVEESCAGPFKGSDCNIYDGVLESCQQDLSTLKIQGIGEQHAEIFENQLYKIKFDGAVYELYCRSGYKLTRIETPDAQWCLGPQTHFPQHLEYVVYRPKTDYCHDYKSIFAFNDYLGRIYHAHSNKDVCTSEVNSGYYLKFQNSCPDTDENNRIARTYRKTIRVGQQHCLGADGDHVKNGHGLVLDYGSTHCERKYHSTLIFPQYPTPPVKITLFADFPCSSLNDVDTFAKFPGSPDQSGRIDVVNIPIHYQDHYLLRGQFYFVPRLSGEYTFYSNADDLMKLYLSTDENESNRQPILDQQGYALSHTFNRPDQTSETKTLVTKKKYYMEFIACEGFGDERFNLYVKVPGSSNKVFLSSIFLSTFD